MKSASKSNTQFLKKQSGISNTEGRSYSIKNKKENTGISELKSKGEYILNSLDDMLNSYNSSKLPNVSDLLSDTKNLLLTLNQTRLPISNIGSLPLLLPKSAKAYEANAPTFNPKQSSEAQPQSLKSAPLNIPNKTISQIDNTKLDKSKKQLKKHKKVSKNPKKNGTFMTDIELAELRQINNINQVKVSEIDSNKSESSFDKNKKKRETKPATKEHGFKKDMKSSITEEDKPEYIKQINEKVKNMFEYIDDSFYDNSDDESSKTGKPARSKPCDTKSQASSKLNMSISDTSYNDPKIKEDKELYMSMIKQVEALRAERKEKETDLEKLIRITKSTTEGLDRHFKVVNKLFKDANLQINDSNYENYEIAETSSEHNSEGSYRKKQTKGVSKEKKVFNKNDDPKVLKRNLGKITDRLLNVTGGVLTYNKNLNTVITEIKEINSKYIRQNSELNSTKSKETKSMKNNLFN